MSDIQQYLIEFDSDDEPFYMRCSPGICETHSCRAMQATSSVIHKYLFDRHGLHFSWQGGKWYVHKYPSSGFVHYQSYIYPVGTAFDYNECLKLALLTIEPDGSFNPDAIRSQEE